MTPVNPEDHLQTARELFEQGDHAAAIDRLDASLAADPDDAAAYLLRGRCLIALERRDEARAALDAALQLEPDDVPTLLAQAELGGGDEGEVLSILRYAHQLEPENARILFRLAEAEYRGHESEVEGRNTALEHLDRSLELDPKQADSWALRGAIHHSRSFGVADGPNVIQDLMGVNHDREALEAALHDYTCATELSEHNAYARAAARTAELLGQYELATWHLDRVLARLPADAPGREYVQEDRDRYARGEEGARADIAAMVAAAGQPQALERTREEDLVHSVTEAAANLIRQGETLPDALATVIEDGSPDALLATHIAQQLIGLGNQPDPDLAEVAAKDFPGYQRGFAASCEKLLVPLGYHRLADAEARGISEQQGTRTLLRLFVHPEYGSAAAFAVKPKWPGLMAFLGAWLKGRWKAVKRLECSALFSDGLIMSTYAAGPDPFDYSAIEQLDTEIMPAGTTPASVTERHMERVTTRVTEGFRVMPVDSLADIEQIWIESNTVKGDYRRSIGYVTDAELRALLGENHDRLAATIHQRLKDLAGD